MWAAEQGKRWHDWSAANQEKLRLGDVSAASSLRPSFGKEGRGRGSRSWDDSREVGVGEWRVVAPSSFCPSLLLWKGPTWAKGKGREGGDVQPSDPGGTILGREPVSSD